MPIFDYNGTVSCEIGRVYDFDGAASHQIGKVYDNNGSANSLIYTAISDIAIIPNLADFPSSSWSFSHNGTFQTNGTLKSTCTDYNIYHYYLLKPIDFTEYKTLSFTFSTSGYFQTWLGVAKSAKVTNQNWLRRTGGYTGTHTMDISDLKGDHYIAFYTSTGGLQNQTLTVSKIQVLL